MTSNAQPVSYTKGGELAMCGNTTQTDQTEIQTPEARDTTDVNALLNAQLKSLLHVATGREWLTTNEAAERKGASPDTIRAYAAAYLHRVETAGVILPEQLAIGPREVWAVRLGASVRKSSIFVEAASLDALQMNAVGPDGLPVLHRTGKPVGWKPTKPYGRRKPRNEDLRYRETRLKKGLPPQDQLDRSAVR